jgi:hypothetical protein
MVTRSPDALRQNVSFMSKATKILGAAVSWVCHGSHQQPYRFVALVPQKLLHRRITFSVANLTIDGQRRRLEVTPSAASNTYSEISFGGARNETVGWTSPWWRKARTLPELWN